MNDNRPVVVNVNTLSFAKVLGLVFMTLWLTDYISWHWFWVFSPFWVEALWYTGVGFIKGFKERLQ